MMKKNLNETHKHTGLIGLESSEENIQCLHLLCGNEVRISAFPCLPTHGAPSLSHTTTSFRT